MGTVSMDIYLRHLRKRYKSAGKKEKGQILSEFCETYKYQRKSACRLLNQPHVSDRYKNKGGRPPKYEAKTLLTPLKTIWFATDQICGKRLKEALPLWLPFYEIHYGSLEEEIQEQLLSMSASTIDRCLQGVRINTKKGLSGTKPGTLLKHQIPILTEQWDATQPGFVEADTVAHCGDSLKGNFVWSLTLTDILTGWTENRAVWNKGSLGVLEQIQNIEDNLPFKLKGFDCDNGSEFLNHHLLRYFTDNRDREKVQFTRSRPYRKDDNAHVEQKNWTHVRRVFGYARFDNPNLVHMMNDLYANELSLLANFFYPSVKLVKKQRIKSKIIKKHDLPKTPYQRLIDINVLTKEKKQELETKLKSLDPFLLQNIVQKKLKNIFALVNIANKKRKKAI